MFDGEDCWRALCFRGFDCGSMLRRFCVFGTYAADSSVGSISAAYRWWWSYRPGSELCLVTGGKLDFGMYAEAVASIASYSAFPLCEFLSNLVKLYALSNVPDSAVFASHWDLAETAVCLCTVFVALITSWHVIWSWSWCRSGYPRVRHAACQRRA